MHTVFVLCSRKRCSIMWTTILKLRIMFIAQPHCVSRPSLTPVVVDSAFCTLHVDSVHRPHLNSITIVVSSSVVVIVLCFYMIFTQIVVALS